MTLFCIIYLSDQPYTQVGWTWTPVCDCHRGGWKCDQNCLENALIEDSLFYPIGTVRVHSYLECKQLLTPYSSRIYIII